MAQKEGIKKTHKEKKNFQAHEAWKARKKELNKGTYNPPKEQNGI